MNDLMTKSFTSYVDLKKATMKDLEAGVDAEMAETNMDPNLAVFLEDAEQVKKEMSCIQDILTTLEQANEEGKSLHKPEALKAHRQRISTDIVTVLKKARAIKAQLTEMDESNEAIRRLSDWKEGNAVYRTRTSVTNGLRKKLKQLMMDFQNLRQKMMSEFRETIGRRYFTVTGELPNEEEIEKIVSSSHGEEFLRKAIQAHGRGGAAETVVEIQDRHDAAKEVEKSLLELHQVFLDMAVMVEAQGEQMDNIEHHVMMAEHYVSDGGKNLATAKKLQKRSRKWMCIAVTVLLVLILVVVIPIAASFDSS